MDHFTSEKHQMDATMDKKNQRRNGEAIIINKSLSKSALTDNLRNNIIISVGVQGNPIKIAGIQSYVLIADAKSGQNLKMSMALMYKALSTQCQHGALY